MKLNVKKFTLFVFLLSTWTVLICDARQAADSVDVRSDVNAALDTEPEATSEKQGLLNVYLDCAQCDRTFIRREIGFVNYVRDRALADIHLFVTSERTGSGGRFYTLSFIGHGKYAEANMIRTHTSYDTDTFDEVRTGLTEAIKRGLVPFVLETEVGDQLRITFVEEENQEAFEPEYDPWNSWVFEVYAGGYAKEESSQGRLDIRYGFYATRVTEKWRVRARPYFNHNIRRFETSDETIRDVSRRHGFDGYVIRSLSDHWSAGLFNDVLSSTFTNMNLRVQLSPALEYSLYPYEHSSRKEITFRYRVLGGYYDYIEETLFDKTREFLYRQSLSATARFQQPWGGLSAQLSGSHYLHDFDKNRIEFFSRVQLRVAKGLQLDVSGSVEVIHDQLFLAKGDATLDEILLQRSQLATTFEFTGRIGFSYTFGSIYNNVVNTRL